MTGSLIGQGEGRVTLLALASTSTIDKKMHKVIKINFPLCSIHDGGSQATQWVMPILGPSVLTIACYAPGDGVYSYSIVLPDPTSLLSSL
jgi:hypothetical protein